MRAAAALLPCLAGLVAQSPVPTPSEVLGREVGADGFLATYTQLVDYWQRVAAASDRAVLRRIGTTSYGQPMWMAILSAPANLARLEELRQISATLAKGRAADGRPLTAEQIGGLADRGKAVVWIDAGLHATESIAGQNIIELVHRVATGDDAEVRRILDEVVLLVCPANPDGMEMVARGYMACGRVGVLPALYQRYVGHDNNRDFYACNMVESTAISRVLYHEWFPQVVYNHHQSAPRGTVIFTPPFRDPFNYNVDPLVVRGIEFVAANINARFAWEGKPGVISRTGASYSTWWNGGLRTTAYFHNMIGILTEVFGQPDPTPLRQRLDRRLPYGDYPMPIETRTWHARDTIEYLQTANFAILDTAARYRQQFLANTGSMAVASIDRGSRDHWTPTPRLVQLARDLARRQRQAGSDGDGDGGEGEGNGTGAPEGASAGVAADDGGVFADPALRDARAYVVPLDQPDLGAVRRLVTALRRTGVDVLQAAAGFRAGARAYPPGSLLIRADQAFRPHLRDMLEPQWHPDDVGSAGEPVRPYDSAGWTLSLQMGVAVDRLTDAVEGQFTAVDVVALPAGTVTAGEAGWLVDCGNSDAYRVVNRLLADDLEVARLTAAGEYAGRQWPRGTFFVAGSAAARERLGESAAALGLSAAGIAAAPAAARPLRRARIGLFDVWGGHMATGWTRWVLEQFGFAVETVFGDAVEHGGLGERFDVLILATGLPAASARGDARSRRGFRRPVSRQMAEKVVAAMPAFTDWSPMLAGLTAVSRDRGVANLRAFVAGGGTLLLLDGQPSRGVRLFDLPVEVGVFEDRDGRRVAVPDRDFFIPGSLVSLAVDASHELGAGMPAAAAAMFARSDAFTLTAAAGDEVRVVATYGAKTELLSGWAIGIERLDHKAAVVEVPLDGGRIVLYGPAVLFRGQPDGTFKLVFNALYR